MKSAPLALVALGAMLAPAAAQTRYAPQPAPRVVLVEDVDEPPAPPSAARRADRTDGHVLDRPDAAGGRKSAAQQAGHTEPGPSAGGFSEILTGACGEGDCGPRAWLRAEFLSWKVEDGPLRIPLATTGDPADPRAGALTRPGTRVLFGGDDLDYGRTNGARLTLGGWFGSEPVGGEVSVFWLESGDVNFGSRSTPAGSPPVYIPVFNLGTGREGSIVISDPVFGVAGNLAINSRSDLWGWEANGIAAASRGPVGVTLLAGFRYLDLQESLTIQSATTDLVVFTQNNQFDAFSTVNRFYGGQVGARATTSWGKWFAGVTGKFAVGGTRSSVDVAGVSLQTGDATIPQGAFPGGVFAQQTNLGRQTAWDCSTVSELGLQVGCQVCGCVRAFAGYDVLYWTRVARPGDQLDRSLNPSQTPIFFGTGVLSGSARPAPLHNRTDLFVQGFTAGLEFRY